MSSPHSSSLSGGDVEDVAQGRDASSSTSGGESDPYARQYRSRTGLRSVNERKSKFSVRDLDGSSYDDESYHDEDARYVTRSTPAANARKRNGTSSASSPSLETSLDRDKFLTAPLASLRIPVSQSHSTLSRSFGSLLLLRGLPFIRRSRPRAGTLKRERSPSHEPEPRHAKSARTAASGKDSKDAGDAMEDDAIASLLGLATGNFTSSPELEPSNGTKRPTPLKNNESSNSPLSQSGAQSHPAQRRGKALASSAPTKGAQPQVTAQPQSPPPQRGVPYPAPVGHDPQSLQQPPFFPALRCAQSEQSVNPVLVFNDKKISYKRYATHVAIAYFIYYQQRFNMAQHARGNPTSHNITLTLDPTQDARLLKTQTTLANGKQPIPPGAALARGVERGDVKVEPEGVDKRPIRGTLGGIPNSFISKFPAQPSEVERKVMAQGAPPGMPMMVDPQTLAHSSMMSGAAGGVQLSPAYGPGRAQSVAYPGIQHPYMQHMMAGRGQIPPAHMQAMMNPQMYAYMMQQRQQMPQGMDMMQYPPYMMMPYGHAMPYGMQQMPMGYQTQMAASGMPPVAPTNVAPSSATVANQLVAPNAESKSRRAPEHRTIEFDKIEPPAAQDGRAASSNEDKNGVVNEVILQKKDGGEVGDDGAEVTPDPMQVEGGEVTAPVAPSEEAAKSSASNGEGGAQSEASQENRA